MNPNINLLKEIVKQLRKENKSINETFSCLWNLSLLHIKQPYETMKYLLDMGGNSNINSSFLNFKPIHFQYDFKTIQLLISKGAQPNPVDANNFNPLFWQKDPESMKYLLRYNDIYNSNILNKIYIKHITHPYMRLLIDGGYDPYSENNISITPIFLQNNIRTIEIIIRHCFYNNITNYDIVGETLLFKPRITPNIIHLFGKYSNEYCCNISHQNVLGNTPLHVQYIPINIIALLKNNANHKIKNNDGFTPYEYHFKKNNLTIANIIKKFSSAKLIQNNWRRFWFNKTFVKPKFYKMKKELLNDFILLPPSQCGLFPGGIEYQKAKENFNLCLV